jgi:hypothetical protein
MFSSPSTLFRVLLTRSSGKPISTSFCTCKQVQTRGDHRWQTRTCLVYTMEWHVYSLYNGVINSVHSTFSSMPVDALFAKASVQ